MGVRPGQTHNIDNGTLVLLNPDNSFSDSDEFKVAGGGQYYIEDFNAGDGGWTQSGGPTGPWTYSPTAGVGGGGGALSTPWRWIGSVEYWRCWVSALRPWATCLPG